MVLPMHGIDATCHGGAGFEVRITDQLMHGRGRSYVYAQQYVLKPGLLKS